MSEIKVKLLSHWGPGDQRVCESAWTSTYDRDKFETKTEEQIDKVINIVVGQGHGTPLESTWLEFYLEIPIYIERQLDKYRMTQQYQDIRNVYDEDSVNRLYKQYQRKYLETLKHVPSGKKQSEMTPQELEWSYIACGYERLLDNLTMFTAGGLEITANFAPMGRDNITQNELSGRYRTIPNRFIEMPTDVAEIVCKAKNNALQPDPVDGHMGGQWDSRSLKSWWSNQLHEQYRKYYSDVEDLQKAVKEGLITQSEYKRAREFLRGILGTAFITHMKLVLNLRAFENILRERLAPDAQPEIQEVAKLMLLEVIRAKVAPKVIDKMCHTNNWDTESKTWIEREIK